MSAAAVCLVGGGITSNDELVFESYAGRWTDSNRAARRQLSLALDGADMLVTCDEHFQPTFAIDQPGNWGIPVHDFRYTLTMAKMAQHATEYLDRQRAVYAAFDSELAAPILHRLFAGPADMLAYDLEIQAAWNGRRHFMTQLLKAMVRDDVVSRMRANPVPPDPEAVVSPSAMRL
ncbi:hypothetical protein E3T61_03120 [Cryobacterium lactosi]|uniref:Uncharacterized protein n=1 Tax=Cryobacterium lactosi TaxID=1259202 RepID=A0A4V3IXY0_9MICO|nr:hypothetical protein [Cryobacterium lactosi]TFD94004.1 hypothetical protein E3T61_03120 [Cryobacterium lactosi]